MFKDFDKMESARAAFDAQIDAQAQAEWPLPKALPEGLPAVAPFDELLLPEAMRPWITDIYDRMQCPPDYPAVGAMVALGSVIGQRVRMRPKRRDSWELAANLWGIVVGKPGAMKSPALGEALKPLNRLQSAAMDAAKAKASENEVDAMELAARQKALTNELERSIKAADPEKPGRALSDIKYDLKTVVEQIAQQKISAQGVRYTTNDPTVEALGVLLANNPAGILVQRDELVGWMRNMDKPGHENDRSFYLEAWNADGKSYTYDRIQRGTIVIDSPCVSVIGGTQPGVIGGYMHAAATGGAGADGLMQRFQMLVWPDDPHDWKNVDRWQDTAARNQASAIFERLARLDPQAIGAEPTDADGKNWFLRFDPEAQELFAEWHANLERDLRQSQPECLAGHFAKYRKLIPSLALISHLADCPQGGPVKVESLERAVAWGDYLKSHAYRAYAPAMGSHTAPALALADRLRAKALNDGFTAKTVYTKDWQGLDREATEKALDMLEELDWLRALPAEPKGPGRPPLPKYAINPRLLEAGV